MDAYHDDLAYIHDVGYGDFAQNAAPGLLDILRHHGVTTGRVIDLGCGSGLWARELVKAEYEVLGIDLSASMIELARQRVPQGDFVTGSFLEVTLPSCDAVTSLGECLNYLFDQRQSLDTLRQLFRRIYSALRPGGVLVFDIAEPGRGHSPRQSHREGTDWAIMVTYEEDTTRHRLTRHITTFRKVDGFYRRGHEVHRLLLYRGVDMARELRRVGFRVRLVRGYGALRFPKCYVGFIARKVC
jgi:SAM-dependent methyltransferase